MRTAYRPPTSEKKKQKGLRIQTADDSQSYSFTPIGTYIIKRNVRITITPITFRTYKDTIHNCINIVSIETDPSHLLISSNTLSKC